MSVIQTQVHACKTLSTTAEQHSLAVIFSHIIKQQSAFF